MVPRTNLRVVSTIATIGVQILMTYGAAGLILLRAVQIHSRYPKHICFIMVNTDIQVSVISTIKLSNSDGFLPVPLNWDSMNTVYTDDCRQRDTFHAVCAIWIHKLSSCGFAALEKLQKSLLARLTPNLYP